MIQADETLPSPTVTYLPITGTLLKVPDIRVPIEPSSANGLVKASEVMVDMIQTSSLGRFGEVIGQVDATTLRMIEAALSVHPGLLDLP